MVGVSEALEQVAKTESVKVAEAMAHLKAHRETYAVSSRVHKQLLQEHKLNIQQKKELYFTTWQMTRRRRRRRVLPTASPVKLPVPKLEDTVANHNPTSPLSPRTMWPGGHQTHLNCSGHFQGAPRGSLGPQETTKR